MNVKFWGLRFYGESGFSFLWKFKFGDRREIWASRSTMSLSNNARVQEVQGEIGNSS